jgi:hypothetical protein
MSDGYVDQLGGPKDKKLKKNKLLSMILDSSDRSIKDQVIYLKNEFNFWKGKAEQVDDVCLLIVEITA